jgi:acyl carrier protein
MDDLIIAKTVLSNALFVSVDWIQEETEIGSIAVLDSLSFEAMTLEIERSLGKEIDPVKLVGVKTVRDLADAIGTMR